MIDGGDVGGGHGDVMKMMTVAMVISLRYYHEVKGDRV